MMTLFIPTGYASTRPNASRLRLPRPLDNLGLLPRNQRLTGIEELECTFMSRLAPNRRHRPEDRLAVVVLHHHRVQRRLHRPLRQRSVRRSDAVDRVELRIERRRVPLVAEPPRNIDIDRYAAVVPTENDIAAGAVVEVAAVSCADVHRVRRADRRGPLRG